MRIACLLVPDLPLHAELRASPELAGQPLVITSGPSGTHGLGGTNGFGGPSARAEILSVSPEAKRYSVRPGQTLPQARAVCPGIDVRVASPVLERTAREALLDVALSLSPRAVLEDRGSGIFATEGVVFVDASGIDALHGTEATFASVLHARAERAGMHGLVTIASTRGIAKLAARHLALDWTNTITTDNTTDKTTDKTPNQTPNRTCVLSPERELEFLAPLSIDLLDPDDRTAQMLTRFGLYRIRDLLRMPRRDLAARLGPSLLALIARARGEENEPPLPEPRTTTLEEGQDLEAPIASLEPLAFVLRGLVSRLAERLDLRGLGCNELRLTLQLENGATTSRRVGIASPCQNERILLRLLRLAVEREPPTAPVEGVRLLSEGVPLRREQLDLFLPRGPSPSELDQTLAELCSICGEERVGAPEIVDSHRPDAFALKPFLRKSRRASRKRARVPRKEPGTSPPATPPLRRHARLTMRALRPPLPAEVRLARGRPTHLRSALRLGAGGQGTSDQGPLERGTIVTVAGPWRTTGHWWSGSAHFAVDHYDVQTSDGTVLRLCFDWRTKRWQIDGLYD